MPRKARLGYRECYRVLGPRLFWRSCLYGFTNGWLPRNYDHVGEVIDRGLALRASEVLDA